MKAKLFFLILLALPAYSQTSISFYTGINPHMYSFESGNFSFLDASWNPGITIGLSGELFLSPAIAISSSIEYAYYGFNNYEGFLIGIPERIFKSATGEPSTEWRAFAEAKLFTKKSPHGRFYVSTGIGYVIEQIGTIMTTYSDMNGHDFTGPVYYENRDYFVHTLGAGERWNIASPVALDVKAQYFTNYSDRTSATIRVGLQYYLAE